MEMEGQPKFDFLVNLSSSNGRVIYILDVSRTLLPSLWPVVYSAFAWYMLRAEISKMRR